MCAISELRHSCSGGFRGSTQIGGMGGVWADPTRAAPIEFAYVLTEDHRPIWGKHREGVRSNEIALVSGRAFHTVAAAVSETNSTDRLAIGSRPLRSDSQFLWRGGGWFRTVWGVGGFPAC